jgi:hypothetical protein
MYKVLHENIKKSIDKDTQFGFSYPHYLHKEYLSEYQFKCKPEDFYAIVLQEIKDCSIEDSEKDINLELWFGKYKAMKLHEIDDLKYLQWICDTHRKKNKRLVGQTLIRMKELNYRFNRIF